MNTVRIYQLEHLPPSLFRLMKQAQMEAAQVWNMCASLHQSARMAHAPWPDRQELQLATKGHFALHSQSVQMVVHAFLANIETTRTLRAKYPRMHMKYPWRTKRFYPVHWPAQAVSKERGRVVLPMGRGHTSLVLPLDLPENSGACTLVWHRGFELHVCLHIPESEQSLDTSRATVDLGEIHLAAVTTNRGVALVVSGRGIRSLKRQRNMRHRHLAKKEARCQKYSRRWKKLRRAKNTMARRLERRVRDLRHRATRKVIAFCQEQQVGTLFIGNPHGVRQENKGRHHNQRMAQWEYGKDIDYLRHKSTLAGIKSFTGSERGTSSQCPVCRHLRKPKGRVWKCRKCGFVGHRDVVGSINMHRLAYGEPVTFPRSVTYLRPGLTRRAAVHKDPAVGCSSRADTPLASSGVSDLSQAADQPLLA
jgi:putative transposase